MNVADLFCMWEKLLLKIISEDRGNELISAIEVAIKMCSLNRFSVAVRITLEEQL